MKVTFQSSRLAPDDRLRERLSRIDALRCPVHGDGVEAVTITRFENGWFDSRWTTCCDGLSATAATIIGQRY